MAARRSGCCQTFQSGVEIAAGFTFQSRTTIDKFTQYSLLRKKLANPARLARKAVPFVHILPSLTAAGNDVVGVYSGVLAVRVAQRPDGRGVR